MTQDEIIALAKECGFVFVPCVTAEGINRPLLKFVKEIERQAYERAAQACIEACCNDLTDAEVVAAIRVLIEGEEK